MKAHTLCREIAMRLSARHIVVALIVAACSNPPVQTVPIGPSTVKPSPAPARPVAARPTRSAETFRTATATIRDAAGIRVGEATFTDSYAGLIIAGSVEGLGIGAHGIHIHSVGKCDPPFTTAGGHYNPENRKHGFRNPEGHHLGDLPNIDVPASGRLRFEFLVPDVALGGPNGLLGGDGAALVIHSTHDDLLTDPAGNSGARLACGVIVAG